MIWPLIDLSLSQHTFCSQVLDKLEAVSTQFVRWARSPLDENLARRKNLIPHQGEGTSTRFNILITSSPCSGGGGGSKLITRHTHSMFWCQLDLNVMNLLLNSVPLSTRRINIYHIYQIYQIHVFKCS